jgi:hypothetical protein
MWHRPLTEALDESGRMALFDRRNTNALLCLVSWLHARPSLWRTAAPSGARCEGFICGEGPIRGIRCGIKVVPTCLGGKERDMAPTATVQTVAPAPVTKSVNGRLRLTYPTRGYAVSRNPFVVWAVLPSITMAFIGLAIAEFFGDDTVVINWLGNSTVTSITVIAFVIVVLGLLLIPAVALKGSLNLTHDGVTFERGRDHLTAGWDQVTGLLYRRDAGLCLAMEGAQQTRPSLRLPGGFNATKGSVRIPLRMFGDRQFSILYDVRDRLPEQSWLPAVQKVKDRSPRMTLAVYAAVVLVCAGAMIAVAIAVSP